MDVNELSAVWKRFSETECRGYSPLYERITQAVAHSEEILSLLLPLPSHVYQPNLLLATVHDRVLNGLEMRLSEIYAGRSNEDVGEAFVECVVRTWHELVPVLRSRFVQTNEIGRVAFLAPALASLNLQSPITLLDVGTSAGLTLTREKCRINYGDFGVLGPSDSPVQVECTVLNGNPPIKDSSFDRHIGLDRNPIDVHDSDDFRWMLACVWPDTGRMERAQAALHLAKKSHLELIKGDAIADLPTVLESIEGPLVVTTTWALVYLPIDQWAEFGQLLATASANRPVYWISAEAPSVVGLLPQIDAPQVEGASASVLGSVRFEGGDVVDARVLAHVHSHGKWMWWYD
ncbi:MAG: hypothetical protein RLZ18_1541 [Actinomycetota bacterium]